MSDCVLQCTIVLDIYYVVNRFLINIFMRFDPLETEHSPQDPLNRRKCIVCGHDCHHGDGPCPKKGCDCTKCYHTQEQLDEEENN